MAPPSCLPISVVIPCWRCSTTIARALDSVRAQTAQPAEVILVDDASADGTADLLCSLASQYPPPTCVKVICLEINGGAAVARNAGWAAARQDYVAFLDADDSWHPRKLEIQYAMMEKNPQVSASGHLHVVTPGSIAGFPVSESPRSRIFVFSDVLWRNRFITSSAVVKRGLAHRFPQGQRHMEDHRLWMDIAASGTPLLRVEECLAAHHKADFGAGGLSAQVWRMERAELGNYAALRGSGTIPLFTYLLLVAWSLAKFARRLIIIGLRPRQ